MEDTIQFLYHEKPNLIQFKNWNTINKNGLAHQEIPNDIVFSDEELNFWNQNGYIVLKNAISKKDCIETQNAIWNFLEMNLQHPLINLATGTEKITSKKYCTRLY